MLRLADVHPSVEKGSVRIWPFCRHSPLFNVSSCRLSSSRRRHWNWKQIRRSAERKEEFCTRQISLCGILALSLLGRARQTDGGGARGASSDRARRTDGRRGKSDSYGGLLSPSPSVNPSLPFWVTGRASCNRRRLCSAFHAPPDIERLSVVGHLVMTGRSWSHHTSTLDRLSRHVCFPTDDDDAFSGNRFGLGAQRHDGVSERVSARTDRAWMGQLLTCLVPNS